MQNKNNPIETDFLEKNEDIKIEVNNVECVDNNIEIIGDTQRYSLTMYLDPESSPNYIARFIKSVERLVRQNDDYKLWLSILREQPKLSRDAFLHNMTSQEVEIQLHHYPFNLYTIVQVVISKLLSEKKVVSTFIAADEVIKLHFDDKIGLVPLTVTSHELAHLGKLKFLRTQIYGQWELFYNEYKGFMDDYDHINIKKLLELKSFNSEDEDIKLISLDYNDIEKIEQDRDTVVTLDDMEEEFSDEDFDIKNK